MADITVAAGTSSDKEMGSGGNETTHSIDTRKRNEVL
jgi:hypothetical protein